MSGLDSLPRLSLGLFPTPLHPLSRLSERLGIDLWVKRDDLSGLGLGGNKVRKLEFLLADAVAQGSDVVLTTGGPQSNHAMLTAAACRQLGLDCVLVLKQRGVTTGGNVLLDDLLGVPIVWVDADSYDDVYAVMDAEAGRLRSQGRHPYLIPVGGSVPLGSVGYVAAMAEMAAQLDARPEGSKQPFDHLLCATGSGGTHAGLVLGAHLFAPSTVVTGFDVSGGEDFAAVVADLVNGAAELLDVDLRVVPDEVRVVDALGAGYGKPSPSGVDAMRTMATTEGLVLDPVYSGKAFGGLLKLVAEGVVEQGSRVLFLHTGGAGGLFAVGTTPVAVSSARALSRSAEILDQLGW